MPKQLIDDRLNDAIADLDRAANRSRAEEKAAAAFSQAKIDLCIGKDAAAVYFATAAYRLRYEPDWSIDTAATDGSRIIYNPDFIATCSRKQMVGLIAHEVMHVTNKHHTRGGDRDPEQWNVAADLAINHPLVEAAMELPDGALMPGDGPFKDLEPGLSAEEYYSKLPKRKQGGGEGDGSGGKYPADPGRCGGVLRPGKGSAAEVQQAEANASEMAAAAEQAVKASGRGNLPQGISRAVRDALEPKVDWKSALREFINRSAKNDYSWMRPNRRFIYSNIYLPGLHGESLGDIVISVDQSGSISDDNLAEFASEAAGILEAYECEATIIYHDTEVSKVWTWRSSEGRLVLTRESCGGTSHVCVFDKIEELGLRPACVVCLTDMDTYYPKDAPEAPVLWVDVTPHSTAKPPFGRVVAMN